MQPAPARKRILFLDWTRGLAALIMLQGHTFHAFMAPELTGHGFYRLSQFFGGVAAAVFLFLTGVTYGLGMNKRDHLPAFDRVVAALKRARYLFLIAILFRIQMWLFWAPYSHAADILKVDVLNLMGASAVVLSVIAIADNPLRRLRWAMLAGVAMAGLGPVMSEVYASGWVSGVPAFLRDYFIPDNAHFSIFPWGAYMAFGLAAGNAIPLIGRVGGGQEVWGRVMQWSAVVGMALLYGGLQMPGSGITIYRNAQFWVDSPARIAANLGVILMLCSAAFLWTEYLSSGWSFVRLLGTTSLPVYWVHVELVYGRAGFVFYRKLGPWQCLLAAGVVVVLMIGMAWTIQNLPWREWAREKWSRLRSRPVDVAAEAP